MTLPEQSSTCSQCGGIDDREAPARELRYARTVCECYYCTACAEVVSDLANVECVHGENKYQRVMEDTDE